MGNKQTVIPNSSFVEWEINRVVQIMQSFTKIRMNVLEPYMSTWKKKRQKHNIELKKLIIKYAQ